MSCNSDTTELVLLFCRRTHVAYVFNWLGIVLGTTFGVMVTYRFRSAKLCARLTTNAWALHSWGRGTKAAQNASQRLLHVLWLLVLVLHQTIAFTRNKVPRTLILHRITALVSLPGTSTFSPMHTIDETLPFPVPGCLLG